MNFGRTNPITFEQRWLTKPFCALLVTVIFWSPTFGQTINEKQLTGLELSQARREQLIKRFELFVEYEKTQSYEKQFDLLARDHLVTLLHMRVDKASYVKFKQETRGATGKLIDLSVKDIKKIPGNPEQLTLSVVVKLQKGKSSYSDTPICVAYLEDGNWYFSLLYVN